MRVSIHVIAILLRLVARHKNGPDLAEKINIDVRRCVGIVKIIPTRPDVRYEPRPVRVFDLSRFIFQATKKINSCSTSNWTRRCRREMAKTVELRSRSQNDCLNPRARVSGFPSRGRIPRGKDEYKRNVLFKITKRSVIKETKKLLRLGWKESSAVCRRTKPIWNPGIMWYSSTKRT